MNYPVITNIIESKIENKNVKTFKFFYPTEMIPGQFFMILIPGIDEIPMSASYIDNNIKGITFRRVGDATNALFKLKKGDQIGIRGPYGNGYKLFGKNILFVGGGTGCATLLPIVKEAKYNKINLKVIIGFRNKNEIFFENEFKNQNVEVQVTTDDGSKGYKGFASDLAKTMMKKNNFTSIITCGPEIMMKSVFEEANTIDFQASLERYMKCGIGLCGQCCVGKGIRICVEGPVLNSTTLKQVEDFGKFKKDASGKKIKI